MDIRNYRPLTNSLRALINKLSVYCLLIFLSACSSQDVQPTSTQLVQNTEPNKAEQLLNQAQQVSEPLATQFRLKASRILSTEGQFSSSAEILNTINQTQLTTESLTAEFLFQKAIIQSHLNAEDALEWFEAISSEQLSRLSLADQWIWQKQFSTELSKNNRPNEAVSILEQQRPFLEEEDSLALSNQIWSFISILEPNKIPDLIQNSTDSTTKEWFTLALILNSETQDQFKGFALKQWLNSNKDHPAAKHQPQAAKDLPLPEQDHIKKIALLLPLSGKFSSVSKAITQGFLMASYNINLDQRPDIQIIDSNQGNFLSVYDNISADLIIGPLSRDKIQLLSNKTQLNIPTIALNSLMEETNTLNLFYMGLQAEDEAKTLAKYAIRNDLKQGAVLTYPNNKGLKLAKTFKTTFEELNGHVYHIQSLEKNWAESLQKTLEIDKSNQRAKSLSRLIKTPIEFTARKREDLQFIYSPLKYQDLRQTNPLMAFYFADDIQILSNSDITPRLYSDKRDKDLNGIVFTDYNWPENEQNPTLPAKNDPTTRFYSWGADSFDIARQLPVLLAMTNHTIKTFSSSAYFDGKNRFIREFPISTVRHGKAYEKHNALKIN